MSLLTPLDILPCAACSGMILMVLVASCSDYSVRALIKLGKQADKHYYEQLVQSQFGHAGALASGLALRLPDAISVRPRRLRRRVCCHGYLCIRRHVRVSHWHQCVTTLAELPPCRYCCCYAAAAAAAACRRDYVACLWALGRRGRHRAPVGDARRPHCHIWCVAVEEGAPVPMKY